MSNKNDASTTSVALNPKDVTASSSNATESAATKETDDTTTMSEPASDTNTVTSTSKHQQEEPKQQDNQSQSQKQYEYYAIVLDSGPIIKQYDFGMLQNMISGNKASRYVTTSSVIQEIRDYQSRQYLMTVVVPLLDLQIRQPSDTSIQQIITFAKQTGDYASLSTVDLHVLALTLDMEKEGCCSTSGSGSLSTSRFDHIRTTPKRKIGLGTILPMSHKKKNSHTVAAATTTIQEEKKGDDEEDTEQQSTHLLGREDYDEVEDDDDEDEEDSDGDIDDDNNNVKVAATTATPAAVVATEKPVVKSSWANLANPNVKVVVVDNDDAIVADDNNTITPMLSDQLASTKISSSSSLLFASSASANKKELKQSDEDDIDGGGGQFDDASDDDGIDFISFDNDATANTNNEKEQELNTAFPSLSAAAMVPYEGEDDDVDDGHNNCTATTDEDNKNNDDGTNQDNNDTSDTVIISTNSKPKQRTSVFLTDEEKRKNLQPVSKSGRVYNSFRKYKGLMKPKSTTNESKKKNTTPNDGTVPNAIPSTTISPVSKSNGSRILSGGGTNMTTMGGVESMLAEDDDGKGWITSFEDIKTIKDESGSGQIVPGKSVVGAGNSNNKSSSSKGPALSSRAACATTDFAMQNVLLQMNLILVSSESGMRIRRLKSWVMRCGACFKIHAADDEFTGGSDAHLTMKRLFCSHCGSGDMMQRISASVDGKTGRLKLHFSKRKQGRHHSIRGTKFSLPKPGTGNRYQGRELLLREDQLLSGAWNQKVKIHSGTKYRSSKSESIFGKDIASSVGCNNVRNGRGGSSSSFGNKGWSSTAANNNAFDDIKVGFGARKNPNSAKGRERRGKKKKSADRACGMRRY